MAKDLFLTSAISQHLVVTLAVYLLGGKDRFVDTEDIAVKAHELAPGRFAWRKYPEYPNLELVRVFLSDAKKPDKGHLLDGSGRRGWTLTPAGLKWVLANLSELESANLEGKPGTSRAGSVDSARIDREATRIRGTRAWQKWNSGDPIVSRAEARDVFRIDSYSKGSMAEAKVDRLRKLFVNQPDMDQFLETLGLLAIAEDEKDG